MSIQIPFDKAQMIAARWTNRAPLCEETVAFFCYVRQLIELRQTKGDRPTLDTYCDWLLHSNLDKHSHILIMRRGLDFIHGRMNIGDRSDIDPNSWIRDLVRIFLSPDILVEEICALFSESGDEQSFASKEVCRRLVGSVYFELIGKRISLDSVSNEKLYSKVSTLFSQELPANLIPKAIHIDLRKSDGETQSSMLLAELSFVPRTGTGETIIQIPLAEVDNTGELYLQGLDVL